MKRGRSPVQQVLHSVGAHHTPPSGQTKAFIETISLYITGERQVRRPRKMYTETEEEEALHDDGRVG